MHGPFPFLSLDQITPLMLMGIFAVIIIAVWTVVLKVFAVWYSARAGQKGWFVALLILNTLGILELIYLIWYRPKTSDSKESVVVPLPKESESSQS